MEKLFDSDDRFLIQRLRSELETAGIPYLMKNEYVAGAVGELPWQDVQQQVWLLDESWSQQAGKLVHTLQADDRNSGEKTDWQCQQCGEANEGEFAICWQCQAPKPESDCPQCSPLPTP